ncbi:MAG: prenyltransferase [Candidatus Bathyarchaeia archaeon]
MSLRTWFMETRPSFLLLTPLNYSVGIAAAYIEGSFNVFRAILGLVGVILAHISINVINDYFDYKSGLDFKTKRTPFSGGSGILPAGDLNPRSVYLFAVGCLLVGGTIGVYFACTTGWALLPLILFAAFTIYFYTTHLSQWYIGEFFTGLNFGFLMAVGAYFIMAGRYSVSALVPAVVPGILGSTLLFINEFPDMEADREAGRRNIVMALGLERSSKLYAVLVASPYFWVLICIVTGLMPFTMLVTFLALPIGSRAVRGALENHSDIERLVPSLAANVIWILATTTLTTVGMVLSRLICGI